MHPAVLCVCNTDMTYDCYGLNVIILFTKRITLSCMVHLLKLKFLSEPKLVCASFNFQSPFATPNSRSHG